MAVTRIAMWSGPRNISTALMRSFGNRADTVVVDEPLYAHYLAETAVAHPGRDEVLRVHERNWRRVAQQLTGPLPAGTSISYQKHMAHHLLPSVGRDWLQHLTHAFLVRDPREMLPSLLDVTPDATVADTGLPQQVELFTTFSQNGPPAVIDARDVLEDPEGLLRALCHRLGVAFSDRMLWWPAGTRDTDGVWATWWYDAVTKSTGFAPYTPKTRSVPAHLSDVLDECVGYYELLYSARITV